MWNLQVQGADLDAIEEYARECLQFSNRYHLSFSVGLSEAMRAGWIEPMKRDGAAIPMEAKLAQWEKDNHVASAGSYFVHRGLAHYYLGEHEKAEEYPRGVKRYLSGLTDNVLKRQWHVFLALNAIALHERGAAFQSREELDAEIEPFIARIETWAALGPLLAPYLAFLGAERERVTGSVREARNLYLDAIGSAHDQQYTFLEGQLNECFGELLLAAGERLVDEMRRAEEEVTKSLREKEALLKEIHHRVKNNLQIIHSMLNLQLPYLTDAQVIELFKESQNRVCSMALIHEKLYQSESLARVDLPECIQGLASNLFLSCGVSGQ